MNAEAGDKVKRSWLSLPIIATITRILSHELALQNEYLRTENKIFKSKIKGRMTFTTEEKRDLIDVALVLGKDLMKEVVSIVKPATILAWQHQLEKQKWDYSDRRIKKPGRPRVGIDIEIWCAKWLGKISGVMLVLKESFRNSGSNFVRALLQIS